MDNTKHSRHTTATAHYDDRVLFLIVADETSLGAVQTELALLPLCARGRAFIEVESDEQIIPLNAPPRMTITWLSRARRSGRPGTSEPCRHSQAALRAVRAWSTEMFVDGSGCAQAALFGSWELVTEVKEYLTQTSGMPEASIRDTLSV